jgi:glc operon protein GlcG
MRVVLLSIVLFSVGVFVGAQSTGAGTVYVDAAKVAAAIAKGGNLVSASDVTVLGSHREAAGQVEVHDKETDVIYVIEGDATFVTGGKMVGGKQSRPNQWLGSDITGGESRSLHKGDVIVVPAGTPHWFKQVPKSVNYFVVKALKP